MSLITKFFVEDEEIKVFDLNFRFERAVDPTGMPMGKPHGTVFKLIFETTRERHDLFMQWAIDTHMMKNAKIVISPVTGTSKSRVMELFDVCCIHHQIYFNNGQATAFENNLLSPRMQELLARGEKTSHLMEVHLTPAIFINDGVKIFEHYWKKTDLSEKASATVLNDDEKEGKVIDYYLVGEEGNRIDEVGEEREIFLVLETEDMAGKKLTIDLSSKTHDFEYQGKRLENDVLKDYQIKGDQDKIRLKVLPANS